MNQVIVFPRGQLAAEDKASMREMGIAVVEADDPSMVVTVVPMANMSPLLTPDDLTMALFEGATQYDGSCAKVLRALRDRMQAREKAVAGKPCPADMPTVQPRLIGWRMADYTAETEDAETARNWSANVPVLPIFEGDPNTKLMAASQGPKA